MTLRGRQRLTDREGKILKWYKDTQGVWTCCVGHTDNAGQPFYKDTKNKKFTAQECDEILMHDLVKYERLVNNALKVPAEDHEFDAFVSITFNVEKFAKSTAIKLFNAGDKAGCAKHIMDWKIPKEIIGRRTTEQSQFLTRYK
jgi:lysozyme